MIQVSLSPYNKHGTKFTDLFRYVQCPELKPSGQTMVNYYKGLNTQVKSLNCLHVHISSRNQP